MAILNYLHIYPLTLGLTQWADAEAGFLEQKSSFHPEQ